eukprot:3484185-Prymnesium_polylepis.1
MAAHLHAATNNGQLVHLLSTHRTGARAHRQPRTNAVSAKEVLAAVEDAERMCRVELCPGARPADGAQLL